VVGDIDDESAEWEVERIEGSRTTKGSIEYLVKWSGYEERSWEPVEHLENAKGAIEDWQAEQLDRRDTKRAKWLKKKAALDLAKAQRAGIEKEGLTAGERMKGDVGIVNKDGLQNSVGQEGVDPDGGNPDGGSSGLRRSTRIRSLAPSTVDNSPPKPLVNSLANTYTALSSAGVSQLPVPPNQSQTSLPVSVIPSPLTSTQSESPSSPAGYPSSSSPLTLTSLGSPADSTVSHRTITSTTISTVGKLPSTFPVLLQFVTDPSGSASSLNCFSPPTSSASPPSVGDSLSLDPAINHPPLSTPPAFSASVAHSSNLRITANDENP